MKRKRFAAWIELLVAALFAAVAPTKLLDPEDPAPDHDHEPTSPPVVKAATGSALLAEPEMRAVNGYVLVSRLDGPPQRYYVARDPDFIAERLREAIASQRAFYEYWDRPGELSAKQVRIACALVTDVAVQHLEPDLDALFDQDPASTYVL